MSDYNYKDKTATKLTDEFKHKFIVNIKGKDAVKAEGLTVLAHQKGIWKMETKIIQFPTQDNDMTAICETTIGGYDYDPVTDKIREVVYSDIGDANPSNCTKMVATAFIRMASTRSQARALRKYTNIDMVSTSELETVVGEPPEPLISTQQLTEAKSIIKANGVTNDIFEKLLMKLFGNTNYMQLTQSQGVTLLNALNALRETRKEQS